MNAIDATYDELDLDMPVSFRRIEGGMPKPASSSKNSAAARARFGRRKGASSFNGAHRRRNKRNYL